MTPLGSYSKFKNNCLRHTAISVSMGALWSIIAGFAVFSVIGFMAFEQEKSVESVATSGNISYTVHTTINNSLLQ